MARLPGSSNRAQGPTRTIRGPCRSSQSRSALLVGGAQGQRYLVQHLGRGLDIEGYDGPVAVRMWIGTRIPSDESSIRDATL